MFQNEFVNTLNTFVRKEHSKERNMTVYHLFQQQGGGHLLRSEKQYKDE